MDCIILAGGLGTRLRETVIGVPKPLAPIRGKPFLDILLDQIQEHVEQVILAVGYKADQIKAYYAEREILFSDEHVPQGTGGALKQALALVRSPSVLALNGDSYFGIDLKGLIAFHQKMEADLTIACRNVADAARYGTLSFNPEGHLTAFREKQPGSGWINGGIYVMRTDLLKTFPDHPFSLEQEAFPALLNKRVFAYPAQGTFIDIGTKDSYLEAQRIL